MTTRAGSRDRMPHLDGLRGIAIALVVAHHFVEPLLHTAIGSAGARWRVALGLSYTGVDLFFALSGYLIGGIIFDHHSAPNFYRSFYVRRTVRIVPLALLCVFAAFAAHQAGLFAYTMDARPWSAAAYLFFAVNFWMAGSGSWGFPPLAPLWSLAIEEQFYLGIPWLFRHASATRALWLVLGLLATAPLVRLALLSAGINPLAASVLPICRMDSLGLGMLAAWLMRSPKALAVLSARMTPLVMAWGVIAAGCAVLAWFRPANGSWLMATGGYTLIALFYTSTLMLLELAPASWPARFLSLTPFVLLGRYSYFIYLFQGMVAGLTVGLVFKHTLSIELVTTPSQLACGLAGTLAAAALSWRWLEAPLIKAGHRFRYLPDVKPVTPANA